MLSFHAVKLKSFKILRLKGKAEVFEVVKFVDKGSFGEVYLVRHMLTRMLFCLKVISRSKLSEKTFNQLVQEIKIQSSLSHPNIIKLYGYTADADNIYLLLEASLGENLYRTMKSKPLVEAAVREHVRKVCEAVEYLHDRNIIHRDIKSENVLLDHSTVKLCDFGWATHSSLLRSTKCGTPVYTPP
jgi:aurora kinase, other